MYRPPDLTKAEWDELRALLRKSHGFTVDAAMHDLNDKPYTHLPAVYDGQIDGTGLSRSGTVSFLDPGRKMHDVQGVNARRYIIRINYKVLLESTGKLVSIPVATGAVDTCTRADTVVTITFRSKAVLAMKDAGEPLTLPKGLQKTEAIRRIMQFRGGERRAAMNIPDRPQKLTADTTLGALASPWQRAVAIADELDLMLYYDAAGFLTARPRPTETSDTFHRGTNGWLIAPIEQTYDFTDFFNEVWFYYGDKDTPPYKALCPDAHPLSPHTLRRTPEAGEPVPFRRIHVVKRMTVKRLATAKVQAKAILVRDLQVPVKITGEIFPFPFIETGDLYRVDDADFTGPASFDTWSLPLRPGNSMPIGWTDVRSYGAFR